jgi:hypothetical protein
MQNLITKKNPRGLQDKGAWEKNNTNNQSWKGEGEYEEAGPFAPIQEEFLSM